MSKDTVFYVRYNHSDGSVSYLRQHYPSISIPCQRVVYNEQRDIKYATHFLEYTNANFAKRKPLFEGNPDITSIDIVSVECNVVWHRDGYEIKNVGNECIVDTFATKCKLLENSTSRYYIDKAKKSKLN